MKKRNKFAVLINPPIYDTQYWARWSMPHGLLKIATWLRENGYDLKLYDCLNPYSSESGIPERVADFESYDAVQKEKKSVVQLASTIERSVNDDDIGPSYRLKPNEKWKYVFGMPIGRLEQRLYELKEDLKDQKYEDIEVWITSIMTYWWESTKDVIDLALKIFPNAKIRVGGIYPTLAWKHAKTKLGIECKVIEGKDYDRRLGDAEGYDRLLDDEELMAKHLLVRGEIRQASDEDLATDLYEKTERPPYTILTSSRGCPHICSYCASHILNDGTKVRNRGFKDVINEIREKFRAGTKAFCFYEDNLLMNMLQFKAILKEVMSDKSLHGVKIYAPEGIEIGVALSDQRLALLKLKSDKRILATFMVESENDKTIIKMIDDLTGAVVIKEESEDYMKLLVGDQDEVILKKVIKDNGRHEIEYANEDKSSLGLYLVNVPEIVYLMKLAGFEKIYLPLETIKKETNERWNRSWNSNLSRFEALLNALEEVGFDTRKQKINSFVMFGLPGEDLEEIYDTALYASERVGSVIPMLFTPVPSTDVYEMYKDYIDEHGYDLQHLNGKLFPFFHMLREQMMLKYPDRPPLEITDYMRVESFMQRVNTKVHGESVNIYGDTKVASTFRKAYSEYESILEKFL